MTADILLAALKAEGLKVVEYKDWRTHERDAATGKDFGPVNGVVIHHTASGTSGIVDYCYDGSSALPGPLCHGVIDKSGVVYLMSKGRANHAGGGDPDVKTAVINESYGDYPPATNEHEGSSGAVDGNDCFYGFECVNKGDGVDPWPAAQVTAMVKAAAAICRHYGWSAKSTIGHDEWSDWKSDPKGIDMKDFRSSVQVVIDGGADGASSQPEPKPVPVYAPFPGVGFFRLGRKHALVKAMGKRLVAEGYKGYKVGPSEEFTRADVKAYAWYQRKLGYEGSAADGYPGKASWAKLKVPKS
jgi:hypothetical protein